jgi:hypothetical protein
MTLEVDAETSGEPTSNAGATSRREAVRSQVDRLIIAIRDGDEAMVEDTVLTLSQRSRWLAPLAMLVGAFAMLFQGVKLLFTNWRLTLVQILPAMWIWAAMFDLKAHFLHGKGFHVFRGPLLIPVVLAIAAITAAAFFLNAVFAFAISTPGQSQIRPAFAQARQHKETVLGWGFAIGLALGFSTVVVQRWGLRWFGLALGIVVGVLMFTYVLIPARLLGVKSNRSRRDKLSASAIGGAVGAVVCAPSYVIGRVAVLMLGSHTFRVLAVVLLTVAIVVQTGATSAVKAIKVSAKLVVSQPKELTSPPPAGGPTSNPPDTAVVDGSLIDPIAAIRENGASGH